MVIHRIFGPGLDRSHHDRRAMVTCHYGHTIHLNAVEDPQTRVGILERYRMAGLGGANYCRVHVCSLPEIVLLLIWPIISAGLSSIDVIGPAIIALALLIGGLMIILNITIHLRWGYNPPTRPSCKIVCRLEFCVLNGYV